MSARAFITTALIAAGVLAPAAVADAAKKKASTTYPTVTSIAPMRVSIGETMTITGKGFLKGKAKNTVVFRRTGQRSIFVKADGVSATRLTVKVPAKLESSLGKAQGAPVATRFQIRVLARRFGKKFTPLAKSPMVLPRVASEVTELPKGDTPGTAAAAPASAPAAPVAQADPPPPPPNCDRDGQADDVDIDDDNDLLLDTTEAAIGTNRCVVDSDGDGMEDGWEYQSAIDLNELSCPQDLVTTPTLDYPTACPAISLGPVAQPWPNPSFADAYTDHDGDWMTAGEEHAAWKLQIQRDASYRVIAGDPKAMYYSDGKQASVDTAPETNNCRGLAVPPPFDNNPVRREFRRADGTYPTLMTGGVVDPDYEIYTLDRGTRHSGDGCLNDAERDEDGDYLTNVEEAHGEASGDEWWNTVTKEPLFRLRYSGTNWLVADTDRDGTIDGLDDQDFDDFLNVEEVVDRGIPAHDEDGEYTGTETGLWLHVFNPCLPAIYSRSCPTAHPAGQPGAWRPWFSKQPESPRWPLYRHWLWDVYDAQPNWTDPNGPGNAPDQAPDISPPEYWDAPASVTQSLPPQHPLPREVDWNTTITP